MVRASQALFVFAAVLLTTLCAAPRVYAGLGTYGGQGAASERGKLLGPAYRVMRASHAPSAFEIPAKPGCGSEWR